MEYQNLVQGSPEWKAYRATHFNASDAPAMLGLSPYKTRTQLLNEMKSGIAPEIDAETQRRFDDGHRFEALARPLAEEIIGQDLYPVTGSEGKLSASFDGLTMDETICFEHKTINDEIRAATCAADLGAHLRVQMEQQLMIANATKCLFMASKWEGETLVEEVHHWYESDQEIRDAIIQGWCQFAEDLENHVIAEIVEAPKAESIMRLPALAVQIRGEVVVSNMPEFKAQAEAFINNIKTDLETDQDFADADATVKFCEKAEKDLELAKAAAIAQTSSIDKLMRTVDYIQEQLRSKRLMLEKLVKSKKESIKLDILNRGKQEYQSYVDALEKPFAPIKLVLPAIDLATAIKNKRTLASLNDAVDTTVAQGKAAANAVANALREQITWYESVAAEHKFLFHDLQQIVFKPADDFQLLVNSRIDAHKAAEAKKAEDAAKVEEQAKAQEAAQLEAEKAILKSTAQVQQDSPVAEVVSMKPTRDQIIFAVAMHFKTDARTAAGWIESTFFESAKAA
ncbi:YqaJ viral recombinase family protein [Undibacterium baiyunense]|uniref:YqaJ viral recombinase family protein n=1 Tax=Undibacterium baiyunense TaxID=2828731 RepID=A0A941DIB0_9BURK|nr:YqaJ viral recombinase family protein [Undibacterium baiyunense]MBR7747422.1 YqaJ viral recombinase family protein [Undibacterium baiyunense]